jgi:hypothetical protein
MIAGADAYHPQDFAATAQDFHLVFVFDAEFLVDEKVG